ncbi:MAG: glycosyltransferase family 4 protein [Beijerinckiaceae bacterium]|nr:glycosyltransferase family 4 protein [Beijerinckiaceae bacterium]
MRRIVFVNRYFAPDHSATSQILTDLALHLAGQGRDVHVIAADETYDGERNLPAFELLGGVNVHRVKSGGFGRAGLARRAADAMALYWAMRRAALKLLRPDDILVSKTDPPLLSVPMANAAARCRAHHVSWLQDLYPEVAAALGVSAARGRPGDALAFLRNRAARNAAMNVVIGERMRDRLLACGVEPGRICVIPNWSDDEAIRPVDPDDNPLRRQWGLNAKFVVGYSGNLGRAHECDTLVAAARLLRAREDIVFLFIGGGHQIDRLRAEIGSAGLSGMFRFQPYQKREDLTFSLGVPDAHWISLRPELEGMIVPSKFFGIAAAGRPTISVTDAHGETASLVNRYACGLVVAPGDGAGLAAAIERLAAHPDERLRMGVNARAIVDGDFAKKASLRRWATLLDEL